MQSDGSNVNGDDPVLSRGLVSSDPPRVYMIYSATSAR